MSEETRCAFAHPLARAEALAGPEPRDRISLRDHIVEVEIGAFQAERGVTQRLSFNVVVEVVPLSGEIDDDVDRILSYDRVTEAIAAELAAERLNLLETLAERIADRILTEPQACKVFVRIEKLDRGPGALGVEIVRVGAAQGPGDLSAPTAERPQIIYLSNAAITAPHLPGWLDQLETADAPLVFCVGLPDDERPKAGQTQAQRRIDLLAIEQNAWLLAARAPRLEVVSSRTELDWAMKNGQSVVWAPSRIVLDAVDGPEVTPNNAPALAAWFAKNANAVGLLVIGAEAPDAGEVPVTVSPAETEVLPR
ncbi:dihydroneopterin aldolase [Sulfitobacter sp. PS-8MA]|uniref:dihydroneopterin aldolase n=1 Tax=Sulfitobacter sp. PS-8MA TaxID=3237707 RepID=UPI0034C5DF80